MLISLNTGPFVIQSNFEICIITSTIITNLVLLTYIVYYSHCITKIKYTVLEYCLLNVLLLTNMYNNCQILIYIFVYYRSSWYGNKPHATS